MNKVPKIAAIHIAKTYCNPQIDWSYVADICNKAIEIALAEASAELKAMYEQQVKDGTLGDFVWTWTNDSGRSWSSLLNLNPSWREGYQYRCTPKPTCQVRNLDTGELKTMTRDKAKLLQAELGNTIEWKWKSDGIGDIVYVVDNFTFNGGIYTYKQKANLVKLDGELMTREAAIAKWESKKDTCDLYVKNSLMHRPCAAPAWHVYDDLDKHEYQLREIPTVKLTIDDEPAKMLTPAQCEAERLARIDTHDVWYTNIELRKYLHEDWRKTISPHFTAHSASNQVEYHLTRKQPKVEMWCVNGVPIVPVGPQSNTYWYGCEVHTHEDAKKFNAAMRSLITKEFV